MNIYPARKFGHIRTVYGSAGKLLCTRYCWWIRGLKGFTFGSNTLTALAISVDRQEVFFNSIRYASSMTRKRVAYILTAVWRIPIFVTGARNIWQHSESKKHALYINKITPIFSCLVLSSFPSQFYCWQLIFEFCTWLRNKVNETSLNRGTLKIEKICFSPKASIQPCWPKSDSSLPGAIWAQSGPKKLHQKAISAQGRAHFSPGSKSAPANWTVMALI